MVTRLPANYEAYVSSGALTEGSVEGEPGYFVLWPLDEIAQNNADVDIQKYAPGFVAFGGNGGGELLAFDRTGAVVMLPMIGLDVQHAIKIAESWEAFEKRICETGKP